jgi:hypothetical protein
VETWSLANEHDLGIGRTLAGDCLCPSPVQKTSRALLNALS